MAACYRLRERLSVGLINIDNFRVAAVDQLRTYADLLEVPLRVVTSPREMPQALQELATVDLVLIDTAGRSPNDVMKLKELRSYLQAAQADEIQLVLSLTSDRRLLERTVEASRCPSNGCC
ncbi:MAG: hypothetical protein R3B90_06290 [Planctomycetaceae bacterium]